MNATVGTRVRLVAPLANEPDSAVPVERLPVGTEGTIDRIGAGQIGVRWDDGCALMLLDGVDDGRWVIIDA